MQMACSAAACHSVPYITGVSIHKWLKGVHSLEKSLTLLCLSSVPQTGKQFTTVLAVSSNMHACMQQAWQGGSSGVDAYFETLQGGQWNDQNGGSKGREASLQQEGQQHAQVGQQVAAELQHCDDLLTDAGLLPAQLLHLHNTLAHSNTL